MDPLLQDLSFLGHDEETWLRHPMRVAGFLADNELQGAVVFEVVDQLELWIVEGIAVVSRLLEHIRKVLGRLPRDDESVSTCREDLGS